MGATRTAHEGGAPAVLGQIEELMRTEGYGEPRSWSNGPGETFDRHSHDFDKVLFCLTGRITFHTDDGDLELSEGDRIDIEAGTDHWATMGPEGVSCVEATR